MSEPASLDIIIVSYEVRDELDACLRVLEEDGRPGPGTTVTVVDNASSDGTAGMVRQRWPAVRVIEAGANVGFARANNLGIRSTTADFVLLLNPDTRVNRGAIATLMTALGSATEAAAVGPRLVDDAGRAELSFGPPLGPLGEVRQKVIGWLYDRGSGWVARWVERRTREAGPRDWLTAACLLLRRRDVEAVGLMDETFFMYTEDVDLCVRLRQRGRQLLFVPAAEVVHLRGRSSGRNPATERLRRRSQLAYYAKHHPRWLPWLRVYLRLTGRPVE